MTHNTHLVRGQRYIIEVYCTGKGCGKYIDNSAKSGPQRVQLARKHSQETGHPTTVLFEQQMEYKTAVSE